MNKVLHLLQSMGVLTEFSICKRVNQKEIDLETKRIKKIYKGKNAATIKKLVIDSISKKIKESVTKKHPPGLVVSENSPKKEKLDRLYMESSMIAHALANQFLQKKLTKQQICFIMNAISNLLGIDDRDFENFRTEYEKYKRNEFDEDDNEE